MLKKTEALLRIFLVFGDSHPKHVDRHTKLAHFEAGSIAHRGTASIRTKDEIRPYIEFAMRCFGAHTSDAIVLDDQVGYLVFHAQFETRETLRPPGKKIKEIPLRHEGDEFAVRRQSRKVSDRHSLAVNDAA